RQRATGGGKGGRKRRGACRTCSPTGAGAIVRSPPALSTVPGARHHPPNTSMRTTPQPASNGSRRAGARAALALLAAVAACQSSSSESARGPGAVEPVDPFESTIVELDSSQVAATIAAADEVNVTLADGL